MSKGPKYEPKGIMIISFSLYSKQKGMSGLQEDGMAGRGRIDGGTSIRGDHRGGLPERGRGRGVGRGGGINTGGIIFKVSNTV